MDEYQTAESPEVAPQQDYTENVTQNAESQANQSQNENRQDRNWKAARERQKDLERELRMQKELNERLLQMTPQHAPKQEIDEFDAIASEDYLQKGQVEKLVQKKAERIAQDIAQREVAKVMHERDQSQFMHKLKQQFSDFDDVVNAETIELLETQEPELAQSIAASKDPYKIGIASYKYIKALNLADQVGGVRRSKEIDKAMDKNSKTVQTPQAFDKRPMAQAFKMSESEKTALYQEMYNAASKSGFGY
jgi:hypothetical protein